MVHINKIRLHDLAVECIEREKTGALPGHSHLIALASEINSENFQGNLTEEEALQHAERLVKTMALEFAAASVDQVLEMVLSSRDMIKSAIEVEKLNAVLLDALVLNRAYDRGFSAWDGDPAIKEEAKTLLETARDQAIQYAHEHSGRNQPGISSQVDSFLDKFPSSPEAKGC